MGSGPAALKLNVSGYTMTTIQSARVCIRTT
jgi:hypothetical protein